MTEDNDRRGWFTSLDDVTEFAARRPERASRDPWTPPEDIREPIGTAGPADAAALIRGRSGDTRPARQASFATETGAGAQTGHGVETGARAQTAAADYAGAGSAAADYAGAGSAAADYAADEYAGGEHAEAEDPGDEALGAGERDGRRL
ncbi:MAG: hypothetical protein J2P34_08385, partial [Actinobacteria bacterium]|nr:hypothetical protein [Actinomycetota bacterium]